jgi:hypothetical protein
MKERPAFTADGETPKGRPRRRTYYGIARGFILARRAVEKPNLRPIFKATFTNRNVNKTQFNYNSN